MKRRTFLAVCGAGTTVGLAGCLGGRATSGDEVVGMSIDSFRPEELTIPPETTVEFANTSSHGHTVTGTGLPDEADKSEYFATGGFDSEDAAWDAYEQNSAGVLTEGESYSNEFVTPGRYDYICIPHIRQDMRGVIYVEEGASE